MVMESSCTESVVPTHALHGLFARKVFPNMGIGWGTLSNILCEPPCLALTFRISHNLPADTQASVGTPHSTDLITDRQTRHGGAAQISWMGSLKSLESPEVSEFSAFSGHPGGLGSLSLSQGV